MAKHNPLRQLLAPTPLVDGLPTIDLSPAEEARVRRAWAEIDAFNDGDPEYAAWWATKVEEIRERFRTNRGK